MDRRWKQQRLQLRLRRGRGEDEGAGLVALQTAVRQYRRPALAVFPCSVLRGAGGRLSSLRATFELQYAPIGIAMTN